MTKTIVLRKRRTSYFSHGFTLVELLISVSIIGILAGITISGLNVLAQRGRAQDAVIRKDIEQTVQALESFYVTYDYYPLASGGRPNDSKLIQFVNPWPTTVVYIVSVNQADFAVYALLQNQSYLKYSSPIGKLRNCKPTNITQLNYCDQTD